MAASKKRSIRLKKIIDAETPVRCSIGYGCIREEVWQDQSGKVVRFNLAFINPFLFARDHGRVLGYDNAHGYLHRHFMGKVETIPPNDHDEVVIRFLEEVAQLRRKKEP